jgi:quaternary ammonium compound-resistance protein SugE
MNWIILIIAGLFEVAFAFCLGKAKETTGNEMYFWYAKCIFGSFFGYPCF